MSASWGREGVSSNADKSGQGEGGDLAECGHPFQCSVCKGEEGIQKSFYYHPPVLKIVQKR